MSAPQELFDARLKRALESAPDAHLLPDAAVRQAVLKAAHEAVAAPAASASAAPWWSRWRGERGAGDRADRGRMPWNAAFATVLVAGFVALLWQGQEVPDARVDSAAPQAAQSTPSAAAPSAAAPPAVPPPDAARAGERDRLHERERERRDDRSSRKAAAPQQGSQELAKAVPQEEAAAPLAPGVPPAAAPLAPGAPPAAAPLTPPAAMADASPPPVAAAPMPQAAPAPRPQAAAAPAAGLAARREVVAPAPLVSAWTALRVPEGARATPLARADAGNLPGLLQSLTVPRFASSNAADSNAGSGAASATAAPAAPLRLELMRGADLLGVLEISGGQWRFTPVGEAAAQSGRVDAQTVQALRAELQRLGLLP